MFDGRNHHFNLDQSLKSLERQLPLFEGEIPSGSFALVAYTANAYHRGKGKQSASQDNKSNLNLALNINWAIVLGVQK